MKYARNDEDTPLVKGGQGRTDDEVMREAASAAEMLGLVVAISALTGIAVGLWWMVAG